MATVKDRTLRKIVRDMAVFRQPDGTPFSMDPRWQDSRIREAWEAMNPTREPQPEVDEEEVDEVEEEVADYADWTNEQLRTELAHRKLSVDGKKADLVARLEEDDAKQAEE